MRPEDNQDFMGLYRERAELERERDDRRKAAEFDDHLIKNEIGSPRQREAWELDRWYARHRIGEINTRLAEIEEAVTGKKPEEKLWTPSPEFQKKIIQMIEDYNAGRQKKD